MAGITMQVEPDFKSEIEHFSWINWSAIAREEVLKKEIFERYIETGKLSDEEQRFCYKIDWHPVDWLPLKESFIKELKEIEKGPHSKPMNAEEFEKWCDEL